MIPDLKAQLLAGQPAVGCWLELMSPIAAEIVGQAGYDCVLIDMEHGAASYGDAIAMMQAVAASGVAPLIRVPFNEPVALKRALDTGVSGVMIPGIDNRAEAEAAVSASHYPPRGKRGMAPSIIRASGYGRHWQDYIREIADKLLVICQIESAEAVTQIDEIAAVEGVDMLFIGPFDLSASFGHVGEPDHPEVLEAIATVEKTAKAAGRLLGSIPTAARPIETLLSAGHRLILPDVDSLMLRNGASDGVERWRAALEQRNP